MAEELLGNVDPGPLALSASPRFKTNGVPTCVRSASCLALISQHLWQRSHMRTRPRRRRLSFQQQLRPHLSRTSLPSALNAIAAHVGAERRSLENTNTNCDDEDERWLERRTLFDVKARGHRDTETASTQSAPIVLTSTTTSAMRGQS